MSKETTTPPAEQKIFVPKEPSTPQEETAVAISDLRKAMNEIEVKLEELTPSRENELVYTSTQLSIMWLGKAIGALRTSPPVYTESANPLSPVIEKRTDLAEKESKGKKSKEVNEVSDTKELRQLVGAVEVQIRSSLRPQYTDNRRYQEAMQYAHKASQEAIMWLGKSLEAMAGTEEPPVEPPPVDEIMPDKREREKEREDKGKASKK